MRLLFAIGLLLLIGCSREIPDEVTELTYATPYSPSHPFSLADQTWMQFVERESGGRIRIRPIWSGGLISSDESMEELRHGVADIGLITPIYTKGGAHLIRVQSGFYSGVRTVADQVALYRCIAAASPQVSRELEGLKVLAVQGGSLPGIITADRPVRSLDDMRGLRLRAPTELMHVLRGLGVDPVNMPMGEVYSALAKGIIDGVIAPGDAFKALHFADVAGHYTDLSVPRGAYPARAMSKERWDGLPADVRDVLQRGIPVWEAALAEEVQVALAEGFELARGQGIAFHDVSAEDQQQFDRRYLEDARNNAASLERYGIDGLKAFRAARASIDEDGNVSCEKGN